MPRLKVVFALSLLWALNITLLPAQGNDFGPDTEPLLFQRFLESLKTLEELAVQKEKILASDLPPVLKKRYLSRLSAVLETQGSFSASLESLEAVNSLERDPGAVHRMGHLYLETGNFTDAQAAAHELSAEADSYWRVRGAILQARLWRGQGLSSAAEDILKKSAQEMPGLPDPLYLWESAQASGVVRRDAVSSLAARFFPKSPEALLLAGGAGLGTVRAWGIQSWRSATVPLSAPGDEEAAAEGQGLPEDLPPGEYLQTGAYREKANAELQMGKISDRLQPRIVLADGLYRVWVPRSPGAEKELAALKITFVLKKK